MAAQEDAPPKEKRRGRGIGGYDGELASSILLEDGEEAAEGDGPGLRHPKYHYVGFGDTFGGEQPPLFGGLGGLAVGDTSDARPLGSIGSSPSPPPRPFPRGRMTVDDGHRDGDAPLAPVGSFDPTPSPPSSRTFPRGRMTVEDAPFSMPREMPNHSPARTPSPMYEYTGPKKVPIGDDAGTSVVGNLGAVGSGLHFPFGDIRDNDKSSSSSSRAPGDQGIGGMFVPPPFFNPFWAGGMNPAQAQAYYGMMVPGGNPLVPTPQDGGKAKSEGVGADAKGPDAAGAASGMDPGGMLHMMMAMQASQSSASSATPSPPVGPAAIPGGEGPPLEAPLPRSAAAPGNAVGAPGDGGKKSKSRKGDKASDGGGGRSGGGGQAVPAAVGPVGHPPASQASRDKGGGGGGKGEKRRRGGGGGEEGDQHQNQKGGGGGGSGGGGGGKSRPDIRGPPSSNPLIEQLKARDRNVELTDLAWNISEIAQDQYGSRLIQQKLEVASEEEKQIAFKSVLQKMQQLTTDVFGNYVIQKFFECGNPEQRRILSEQLVGQVLRLSLQMYGCRVVQKALDSVPIEQQVLLVGELKTHVIKCIEDQHGNHVIQKCIERLPTDRINFVVESFEGQTCRMAKHCYGCRVIQRLIEYCSSVQISTLLQEVLSNSMELATDQYGNYVVQHVMEHSNRQGDRAFVLHLVRKNVLTLSCHKYASNVVEKALSCSTPEERAVVIQAIVGEHGDPHPPLLTMMRDRFGNYIVQRTIALAAEPQRSQLISKLNEQLPALKKSNTYGKHIISALEKAQANGPHS